MTLLLKERYLCEIVCDTNKAGRSTLGRERATLDVYTIAGI